MSSNRFAALSTPQQNTAGASPTTGKKSKKNKNRKSSGSGVEEELLGATRKCSIGLIMKLNSYSICSCRR